MLLLIVFWTKQFAKKYVFDLQLRQFKFAIEIYMCVRKNEKKRRNTFDIGIRTWLFDISKPAVCRKLMGTPPKKNLFIFVWVANLRNTCTHTTAHTNNDVCKKRERKINSILNLIDKVSVYIESIAYYFGWISFSIQKKLKLLYKQ